MTETQIEQTRDQQAAQRAKLIQDLGLTLDARFVPWSQSRNKNEKTPSLNWIVTLKHDGWPIIETDYTQGMGHAPSAKLRPWPSKNNVRAAETCIAESGREIEIYGHGPDQTYRESNKRLTPPKLEDVLYALLMDASAIDEGTFENWAASLGYDTDSRKAEAIWRQCVDIALKLRAALGDNHIAALRDAFQNY